MSAASSSSAPLDEVMLPRHYLVGGSSFVMDIKSDGNQINLSLYADKESMFVATLFRLSCPHFSFTLIILSPESFRRDVRILANGGIIRGHASHLCTVSPMLRAAFSEESEMAEAKTKTLDLSEEHNAIFVKKFVQYLYTGQIFVDFKNFDEVSDIIALSRKVEDEPFLANACVANMLKILHKPASELDYRIPVHYLLISNHFGLDEAAQVGSAATFSALCLDLIVTQAEEIILDASLLEKLPSAAVLRIIQQESISVPEVSSFTSCCLSNFFCWTDPNSSMISRKDSCFPSMHELGEKSATGCTSRLGFDAAATFQVHADDKI